MEIALDLIDPSLYLIREIDGAAVNDLRESIKQFGVLQPILVKKKDNGRFEIIFGNHRFYAAKGAGLLTIPCEVRDVDSSSALLMAAVENIQRLAMDPIKEGELFDRLFNESYIYSASYLAQKLGKSEEYIVGRRELFRNLHPELKKELCKRLTLTHARQLCKLAPNQQLAVFQKVEVTRQTEENRFKPKIPYGGCGGSIYVGNDYCTCPKCGTKHLRE